MAEPAGSVISVRGEGRRTLAPDYVLLPAALTVARSHKADALEAGGAALGRLIADLRRLGGVPLSTGSEGASLTWSAQSVTTEVERDHNERTGRFEPTGQIVATVAVVIAVRDFVGLDALGAALAGHEPLHVHGADWRVDADNPAWPQVRADAVRDAIAKGRDYAAALGGTLHHVEHLADVGLLDGAPGGTPMRAAARLMAGDGGEPPAAPSLDPMPQEVVAGVEARFVAAGVVLPSR